MRRYPEPAQRSYGPAPVGERLDGKITLRIQTGHGEGHLMVGKSVEHKYGACSILHITGFATKKRCGSDNLMSAGSIMSQQSLRQLFHNSAELGGGFDGDGIAVWEEPAAEIVYGGGQKLHAYIVPQIFFRHKTVQVFLFLQVSDHFFIKVNNDFLQFFTASILPDIFLD